jgi:outer membrane protein
MNALRHCRGRRLSGCLAALIMATSLSAAAQTDDLAIGYVNPGRVSDEAPQADAARQRLQQEFAPRDEEIVALQESLRALEDRLARERMDMDSDEEQALRRQIVNQRRQIQRQQEIFREDFNLRRNEALGDLQQRILRVVERFAAEQGYDLVVSDGVVFASDAVNITDRIIERLERQHEQGDDAE